jgi:hypothetical protein
MMHRSKPYRSSLYDRTTIKQNRLAMQTAAQNSKGRGQVLQDMFPCFHSPPPPPSIKPLLASVCGNQNNCIVFPQTPDHSRLWAGQRSPLSRLTHPLPPVRLHQASQACRQHRRVVSVYLEPAADLADVSSTENGPMYESCRSAPAARRHLQ